MTAISEAAPEILLFNKGGRDHRIALLEAGGSAPREFFYGYLDLLARGEPVAMLSSADDYPDWFGKLIALVEQAWSRSSHLGLRPWHIFWRRGFFNRAKMAISFTDGYSVTMGLYYRHCGRHPFLAGGFHGLSDLENRARPMFRPLVGAILRYALKGLDHLFFFGGADRDYAIRHYGLDPARTSIYAFGVDTDFWHPMPEVAVEDYVVAIGQDPNRDYDLLAAAPTDQPIRIVTQQKVHVAASRPNVTVAKGSYFAADAMTDEGLRRMYNSALAVILPLKDVYQPTGYSVTLQAMACGRPIVISSIRGLWAPELLQDGVNCLRVPPGDAQALGAAMDRLAADPALRERLGKAARLTAETHFNLAIVRDSTDKLIRICLGNNR